MVPPKLKAGDHVRIIAPSHSFTLSFTPEMKAKAERGLGGLGFTISCGKYVDAEDPVKIQITEHKILHFFSLHHHDQSKKIYYSIAHTHHEKRIRNVM